MQNDILEMLRVEGPLTGPVIVERLRLPPPPVTEALHQLMQSGQIERQIIDGLPTYRIYDQQQGFIDSAEPL